nr:O-antigen ligase family protein [uncultured Ruminococcus sp.]
MKIDTSISTGNLISLLGIIILVPMLIYPLNSAGSVLMISEFVLVAIAIFLMVRKINMFVIKEKLVFMWLVTILPVVVNSVSIANKQFGYAFLFISILFFFLASIQYKGYSFKNLILLIGILSCIYIFSTIIFSFNLDFGLSKLALLFRSSIYQGTLGSAGFTSHYSHNSMYIALGTIAWFSFAIITKKKVSIVLSLLGIVAMLFTEKRGPLIALIISMMIAIVIRDKDSFTKKITKYFIIGIILLVAIYIAYLLFPFMFAVLDRFNGNDNMLSNRQYLWQYAWKSFESSPLFGHGWGYFANSLNITVDTVGVSNMNAHNIYLQLLADTGIIGFLIFIVPMIYTLFVSIKLIRKNTNKLLATELVFSLCFQIFFLMYGFSGNPLYDRQMFVPYMFSVAITIYHKVYSKSSGQKVARVNQGEISAITYR